MSLWVLQRQLEASGSIVNGVIASAFLSYYSIPLLMNIIITLTIALISYLIVRWCDAPSLSCETKYKKIKEAAWLLTLSPFIVPGTVVAALLRMVKIW